MPHARPFRAAALCGALLFSIGGLGAAEAMPAAPALSAGPDHVTAVQYLRYPHRRYRRYNQGRRAGLYRCGLGGLNTHLARKACR